MHRGFGIAIRFAVYALVATLLATSANGQRRWDPDTPMLPMARTWGEYKSTLPPYSPPRTDDGVPDFQGLWGGAGGAGGDDIEEHEYVDVTTPPQESFISDPRDGRIPYTPWALAERGRHRAGLARGWPGETGERLYADPASYCMIMIGPRNSIGEIIQVPGTVIMISAEQDYVTPRIIPTDGRAPIGERAKFWRGNARGRWEGDTLVIEVSNLNGKHWFDSVGNFYSENTRITERLTMVDPNTIDYLLTIEDPTIYTRPWTMNYPIRRRGFGGLDVRSGEYDWRDTREVSADPYSNEMWESACEEGIGPTIVELHSLGFGWYKGVTPPE